MGDDSYIAIASGLQLTSDSYFAVVFGHCFVI